MNTQSIRSAVVLIGLTGVTSLSLAAESNWTRKADMPTARSGLAACVVDGKICAIGGCPRAGVVYGAVEQYDPATDTWWMMPSMQVKRKALAAAVVNGRIYAIGGAPNAGWEPALSTVEEYDPKPMVSVLQVGTSLRLSWNGILQSSDTVDGPNWQELNPPKWPYAIDPAQAGPMKFYRAREP